VELDAAAEPAAVLKRRIEELGQISLRFTETAGPATPAVTIDPVTTDLSGADLAASTGWIPLRVLPVVYAAELDSRPDQERPATPHPEGVRPAWPCFKGVPLDCFAQCDLDNLGYITGVGRAFMTMSLRRAASRGPSSGQVRKGDDDCHIRGHESVTNRVP